MNKIAQHLGLEEYSSLIDKICMITTIALVFHTLMYFTNSSKTPFLNDKSITIYLYFVLGLLAYELVIKHLLTDFTSSKSS